MADREMDMVADMEEEKVADFEVDKVADIDTTWKSNLVREMVTGVGYLGPNFCGVLCGL